MKREIRRRSFLRTATKAAALGVASFGPWPLRRASAFAPPIGGLPLPLPNPHDAPIDHIVVLMMENRSFDHYFGWLTGTNQQTYADPDDGDALKQTFHLPSRNGEVNPYRGCGHPDPDHGFRGGREQRAGGFLAGRNDEFAISYYLPEDIELYAKLAAQFTLCDNYFCSLLGPTFPNREYMHSAYAGGLTGNSLPFEHPDSQHALGFTWPTIWDLLETAGVPWGHYFVDLPATALWGPRLLKGTHHIEHFFADALLGTLPNVTFVDPGFTTGLRTDEHPHSDIRAGQAFVHNVVKALVESPLWPRTALFINYDEWGGFFDHVDPVHVPDDRASGNDEDDFSQAGFRVPTLLASPYARKGFVDHARYDHTSILRFLEWRFLGAPPRGPRGKGWYLTKRDRFANNIGQTLLAGKPAPEFDTSDPFQAPIESRPCEGEELEGLPEASSPLSAEQQRYLEMHGFEKALHAGYYERVGYPVDLRTPPSEAFSPEWALD